MSFTADFWHDWLAHGDFPDHPWRTYLQRSALTLKGLTYAPTGAMCAAVDDVAARDARAASATGTTATPGSATRPSCSGACTRSASPRRPATTTTSSRTSRPATSCRCSTASAASAASRSPSSTTSRATSTRGPVRVGNAAYNQNQHDVWGTLLDSVYIHTKNARPAARVRVADPRAAGRRGDRRTGASPTAASGRCAASRSTSPPRRSSAGWPATAARAWRGCAASTTTAERWQQVADEIRADVLRARRRPRAAALRPALRQRRARRRAAADPARALPARRRRARAQHRVRRSPTSSARTASILRYKVDETDDGLERRGGHVRDLHVVARLRARARSASSTAPAQLCEKMLAYASPLHLYAEEIDAVTGRHLGNFPQAFTHLALINAVMQAHRRRGGAARLDAVARQGRAAAGRRTATLPRRDPRRERRRRRARRRRRGGRAARRRAARRGRHRGARPARRGAHRALRRAHAARDLRAARAAAAALGRRARVVRRRALRRPRRPAVQRPARARDARRARRRRAPDRRASSAPRRPRSAYERELGDVVLDAVLLGLGEDGHTASLFPGNAGARRRPAASPRSTTRPSRRRTASR